MISSARARCAGCSDSSCSRIGSPGCRPISARMASKSRIGSVSVPSRSKMTARGCLNMRDPRRVPRPRDELRRAEPVSARRDHLVRARLGRAARARHVLALDLARVHARRALGHRRQQLLERRRRPLDEPQRVGARDDERAQVRAVEPARLQRRDRGGDRVVVREQQRRARPPRLERVSSASPSPSCPPCAGWGGTRRPTAARAPRTRTPASPAPAPRTPARTTPRRRRPRSRSRYMRAHADRLLAQVVRLLDVQRQDLVGDRALRHQQRQHALGAQLLERGQPVVAVGRPVAPRRRSARARR